MGGFEIIKEIKFNILESQEVDLSQNQEQKKRKRKVDDYDYEDDFIEPFEGEDELVDIECKLENFFVYKGELKSTSKRIISMYRNRIKKKSKKAEDPLKEDIKEDMSYTADVNDDLKVQIQAAVGFSLDSQEEKKKPRAKRRRKEKVTKDEKDTKDEGVTKEEGTKDEGVTKDEGTSDLLKSSTLKASTGNSVPGLGTPPGLGQSMYAGNNPRMTTKKEFSEQNNSQFKEEIKFLKSLLVTRHPNLLKASPGKEERNTPHQKGFDKNQGMVSSDVSKKSLEKSEDQVQASGKSSNLVHTPQPSYENLSEVYKKDSKNIQPVPIPRPDLSLQFEKKAPQNLLNLFNRSQELSKENNSPSCNDKKPSKELNKSEEKKELVSNDVLKDEKLDHLQDREKIHKKNSQEDSVEIQERTQKDPTSYKKNSQENSVEIQERTQKDPTSYKKNSQEDSADIKKNFQKECVPRKASYKNNPIEQKENKHDDGSNESPLKKALKKESYILHPRERNWTEKQPPAKKHEKKNATLSEDKAIIRLSTKTDKEVKTPEENFSEKKTGIHIVKEIKPNHPKGSDILCSHNEWISVSNTDVLRLYLKCKLATMEGLLENKMTQIFFYFFNWMVNDGMEEQYILNISILEKYLTPKNGINCENYYYDIKNYFEPEELEEFERILRKHLEMSYDNLMKYINDPTMYTANFRTFKGFNNNTFLCNCITYFYLCSCLEYYQGPKCTFKACFEKVKNIIRNFFTSETSTVSMLKLMNLKIKKLIKENDFSV